jgi:hypothetical protein
MKPLTLNDRAFNGEISSEAIHRLAARALSRESARIDLGSLAQSSDVLRVGERGQRSWCPRPEARLRHNYEGMPCSTRSCKCAISGSSIPKRGVQV